MAKGLANGHNPNLSIKTAYRLHKFVCIVSAKLQVRKAEQERVKNKTCLSLFLSPRTLWSLWVEFSQQHNVLRVVCGSNLLPDVISRGGRKIRQQCGKVVASILLFRATSKVIQWQQRRKREFLSVLNYCNQLCSKSLTTGAITGE